jgi:beta-lactam-binding protein with PASTA domain
MKPITPEDVALPPTDPKYVDGAPGSRVPSVSGMSPEMARQRLKDAGFQVADQSTPVNSSAPAGSLVGTSPSGQTVPGSIITLQVSNGIAPPPPPGEPPPGDPNAPVMGSTVITIAGLPPITVPVLGPPPPPPPP